MYFNFTDELVFETSATKYQFLNAIKIWNDRPNLVNKRLIGIEIVSKLELTNSELINQLVEYLLKLICDTAFTCDSAYINDCLLMTYEGLINFTCDSTSTLCVYVKELLQKKSNLEKKLFEISVLDYVNNFATFWNIEFENSKDITSSTKRSCMFSYRLQFKVEENRKSCIVLSLLNDRQINLINGDLTNSHCNNQHQSTFEWLKNKLLPKIVKWSEQDDSYSKDDSCVTGSLNLIDVNEYCVLYQKLKDMYGKTFVKIWPESTDPLKFVYEDVAIATYLLLLWQGKKQNFVDMGCGNGLLVHILTCEGHAGLGIDVRSRKIWEIYPEGTAKLEVKTITPTSDNSNLFPDADWLIGNHSDELTPWLPVLAALSSYKCNYFLLPCCAYELNGQKYQRQNSSKSQYMDYIDYIRSLCDFCGFSYKSDKLRIPSTKRICIISDGRNYTEDEHDHKVKCVEELINAKCCSNVNTKDDQVISFDKFKARSSEIKVRNCTQLDRNFVSDLVLLISKKVLGTVPNDCKTNTCSWNEGNPIGLNDLARSIPKEYLKQLKKECGGLQTLIKNHHNIFKIDKGMVSFRRPLTSKDLSNKFARNNLNNNNKTTNSKSFKTRHCWFYRNHPDRCPLAEDECPYIHS